MKRILATVVFSLAGLTAFSQSSAEQSVWLSELDLTKMTCVMGLPKTDRSIRGDTLRIGGETFRRGVGTHAYSRMLIDLHGQAQTFSARVGLDDGAYVHASISFYVVGDQKVLWQSGPVKRGEKPRVVRVDLRGINKLGLLVTVNREDISENYADWAEARIDYTGEKPVALDNAVPAKEFGLLTPPAPARPRINGPEIYGVRPGSPVLYRIPATGVRPLQYRAEELPAGLQLDSQTGIITGSLSKAGRYPVQLVAQNKYGTAKKRLTLVVGESLALTPPMGWNSWYIYYSGVSDSVMRVSANAMVKSGMADYGYQYVNIDDGWMNKPGTGHPQEAGPLRTADGEITGNRRFPDMQGLTAYLHGQGLKAGIYSSPGLTTCAGYAGSYQHEAQDAATFARWGFDFLKYDWCSYGAVAKDHSLETLKTPFTVMGEALKKTGRDLVFNLCQYGMGEVWKWGSEAGHSWRTGPDLGTATGSFLPGFYNVALNNSEHWQNARPGAWNDPDYINLGWVGGTNGGGKKTSFTPNEQYAYMSLWALMASPLFFSGDMSRLDAFLLNVLCNHEVIGVNQDTLGKQGRMIRNDATGMVMVKDLADGSKAVGLFNFPGSKKAPADYFVWDNRSDGTRSLTITAAELGLKGRFRVRDLWTQKDLGTFRASFETAVPYHGVVLLKISQ